MYWLDEEHDKFMDLYGNVWSIKKMKRDDFFIKLILFLAFIVVPLYYILKGFGAF